MFKAEVEANLRAPTHGRIVPLLAAIKHNRKLHIVLPWAEGGNLHSLWEKNPRAADAPWYSAKWLIQQCHGIAQGVAAVHGKSEAESLSPSEPQLHADIKPENILCFWRIDQGHATYVLKLSDFGYAMKLEPNPTRPANIKTYRPPEWSDPTRLLLKYDIWCLGCLYLDFILWGLRGYNGVNEFIDKRLKESHDSDIMKVMGTIDEDIFYKKMAKTSLHYTKIKPLVVQETKATDEKQKLHFKKRYWLGIEGMEMNTEFKVKDEVNSVSLKTSHTS